MNTRLLLATAAVGLCAARLGAQLVLNPAPSRVVGHPHVTIGTTQPNWVEGRELNSPQGIALDTSVSPPVLYVSDTGNNRVLAWRNATAFRAGEPADLVIGQRDGFSTMPLGPGTAYSTGLSSPTGLAVRNSSLYIADSGNNRIIRFPSPFAQVAQTEMFPDLVLGQTSFNSRTANAGGISARTVSLAGLRAQMAFDARGNLYATDPGNRRVLRYPASSLGTGARHGPAADLVLGQPDFTSATGLPDSPQNLIVKDRLVTPSAVAVDSDGAIYVGDYSAGRPGTFSRVLVFDPAPQQNGAAASRVLGLLGAGAQPPPTLVDRTAMVGPEAIAFIDGAPVIADAYSNRLLLLPPRGRWPAENEAVSPPASTVAGQADFSGRSANRGLPEPAADRLSFPAALAAAGGELYVADAGNNRVLAFPPPYSSAARVLGQLSFASNAINLIEGREVYFTSTSTRGQAEAGMALDPRGEPPHLYIADPFNHRVLGFRDARKVKAGDPADLVIGQPDALRSVCNYPNNDRDRPAENTLCVPVAVAVDENGDLYVADAGNARVLRFPKPFAQPAAMPRADLVLGQTNFTGRITDPTARTMSSPSGLAVTRSGVYVADAAHHRVLFFAGDGASLTNGMPASKVLGQQDFFTVDSGVLPNRMNTPRHLAVDAAERLYVADSGNNRVLAFTPQAAPGTAAVLTISTAMPGSALRGPRAVAVHPVSGDIWVADTNGERVIRYAPFDRLLGTAASGAASIPAARPLALAVDEASMLFVADASNRIAVHLPALSAVSNAHFLPNRALAPGMLAVLYAQGAPFSNEARSHEELPAPLPLPRALADTEVLVDGKAAPLFYVSPGQINIQVPSDAPVFGTVDIVVQRRSTGVALAAAAVQMHEVSPGLFTGTGGQVVARNEDGSIASPMSPARRGSVVSLFGTGQGRIAGAPGDGEPAPLNAATDEKPRVLLNNVAIDEQNIVFSGLAPDLVGVWQIDVRIPENTAPGNAVAITVQYKGISSVNESRQPRATIAIR